MTWRASYFNWYACVQSARLRHLPLHVDRAPSSTVLTSLCCDPQACEAPRPLPAHAAELLERLSRPNLPADAIMASAAWPSLLTVLPRLLSDGGVTADAAESLLIRQLAPELLHCQPHPLAQLTAALLRGATDAASDETYSDCGASASPQCPGHTARPQQPGTVAAWPGSVLQLLVVALHTLSRQSHFLNADDLTSLCASIAGALAAPLRGFTSLTPLAADGALQEEQQRQHVALLLLRMQPQLGWWHRLSATASSSAALRQVAAAEELLELALACCRAATGNAGSSATTTAACSSMQMVPGWPLVPLALLSHTCAALHVVASYVCSPSGRRHLRNGGGNGGGTARLDCALAALRAVVARGSSSCLDSLSSVITTEQEGLITATATAASAALAAYSEQQTWEVSV